MIEPKFKTANIPTDGVLILGQDQDARGGDLDPEQSLSGKIGYFNVWDRKLTDAEIERIHSCQDLSNGNVVSWTTSDWIVRCLRVKIRIIYDQCVDNIFTLPTAIWFRMRSLMTLLYVHWTQILELWYWTSGSPITRITNFALTLMESLLSQQAWMRSNKSRKS